MDATRPWFVPYSWWGRGWRPASWEGWLVTACYVAVVLGCCLSGKLGLSALVLAVMTIALYAIIWRTSAKPAGRHLILPS